MVSYTTLVRIVFAAARAAGAIEAAARGAQGAQNFSQELLRETGAYWRRNKDELLAMSEDEVVAKVTAEFEFRSPRGQLLAVDRSDVRLELNRERSP